MIFQNAIWVISLVGMGLVTLGFLYMIFQAGRPAVPTPEKRVHTRSDVFRRWLFGALLIIFAVVSYASLRHFPEPRQHAPLKAAVVVEVVGQQWAWVLSKTQFQTGVPVEFRVTSKDVNHGFAIYAPDGRIVIETQAMPGYVNKVLYTFRRPGTYKIMCLEYCGLAHHVMTADIVVTSPRGTGS